MIVIFKQGANYMLLYYLILIGSIVLFIASAVLLICAKANWLQIITSVSTVIFFLLFIITVTVDKTERFYVGEYDIATMADDYNAEIIISPNDQREFLEHTVKLWGYDKWTYYTHSDEYEKYVIETFDAVDETITP